MATLMSACSSAARSTSAFVLATRALRRARTKFVNGRICHLLPRRLSIGCRPGRPPLLEQQMPTTPTLNEHEACNELRIEAATARRLRRLLGRSVHKRVQRGPPVPGTGQTPSARDSAHTHTHTCAQTQTEYKSFWHKHQFRRCRRAAQRCTHFTGVLRSRIADSTDSGRRSRSARRSRPRLPQRRQSASATLELCASRSCAHRSPQPRLWRPSAALPPRRMPSMTSQTPLIRSARHRASTATDDSTRPISGPLCPRRDHEEPGVCRRCATMWL